MLKKFDFLNLQTQNIWVFKFFSLGFIGFLGFGLGWVWVLGFLELWVRVWVWVYTPKNSN